MQIIKNILYKPYILLFIVFGGWFTYYALNNPWGMTLNIIFIYAIYFYVMRYIFLFLQNSFLKLASLISALDRIPNAVLSGYFYILMLLYPIPVVLLGIISKLFIRQKIYDQPYTDEYGNSVTRIESLTPTVILSRKEGRKGDEEHIVMTKLKKIPTKVTYE
jgi:hypothetical protein